MTTYNGTPGRVTPVGRDQTRVKGTCYEGGIHVPLLVLGPDIYPGEREGLAASVDLPATLLELTGLDPGEASPTNSVSLVAPLGSSEAPTRAAIYAESPSARVLHTAKAKQWVGEEGDQVFRILRDRREHKLLSPEEAPALHTELRAAYDALRGS
ncbi:MAG TPA: hypothetical protein ENJ09_16320 [Planctomycetes bacterium]|nr:hypothetical protein [Planctomycetota bacterium]